MDLCLTARMMDAAEAERAGLVARVVTADKLMEETLAAAKKIAAMGRLAAVANKEAVNAAFETPMNEGLRLDVVYSRMVICQRARFLNSIF